MTEQLPSQLHQHVEVVDQARAEDIITAAKSIGGVAVGVLAGAGENYPVGSEHLQVPEGSLALRIADQGTEPDGMSRFWREADSRTNSRIEAARRAADEARFQQAA